RGEGARAGAAAERLATRARETGVPGVIATGFAVAAQLLLSAGAPEQAKALLAELEQVPGTRAAPEYHLLLPELVRCSLALSEPELAARLADVEPRTPLEEHVLYACRAQLTEADGEHADAAALYAEAAARWEEFGDLPERAYSLLGQGRCLLALGNSGAEVPLAEARELFAAMGYKPALAETDALLGRAEAAAL
ncbi:MAG: hypothetical protein ACRDNY_05855, partial [Gaiellaceae bacterium]